MIGRENGRIDADERAREIDERSAGIALIDGRIRLNEVFVVVEPESVPAECGDDPVRDGLSNVKGVADRKHGLPDLQVLALSDLNYGKRFGGFDFEKCQVRFRVRAE